VDRAVASRARPVAIAIGSNLGDRHAAVAFAIERLSRFIANSAVSEIVETEPLDAAGEVLPEEPLYLNAIVVGTTTLAARDVLNELMAAEQAYGRERPYPAAARTLDLDLILLGDEVIEEFDLQLPHPRFRARFFVLGPLAEVAPGIIDPVTGLTAGELLRRLLRDENQ
jgi:2-amino-4-hydroxy-6-hydroxymethyldihydropteridine diphosphokinase